MEQYTEEYQDITPSTFGKFMKLALFRMILFAIAGALICGLVSAMIYAFAHKAAKVSAMIEYKYAGIELGKDPLGNQFSPTSEITSIEVLDAAVNASDTLKDIDLQKLKNNISVIGVMDETTAKQLAALNGGTTISDAQLSNILNQINRFSSRYVISIEKPKLLGIDNSQAKSLLTNIINSYTDYFNKKYYTLSLDNAVLLTEDFVATEYITISDIVKTRLDKLQTILESYQLADPNFSSPSTRMNFSTMLSLLNNVRSSALNQYDSFVFTNGVSKNKETIEASLDYQISQYTLLVAQQKSIVKAYDDNIKTYGKIPIIVVPGENGGNTQIEIPFDTTYYNHLLAQLNAASKQQALYESSLALWTQRKNVFKADATPELITTANQEVAMLLKSVNDFTTQANTLIADYYQLVKISKAFTIVASPSFTQERALSLTQALLITLIGLIIGAATAMIVTKAKKTKFETAKEQSSTPVNMPVGGAAIAATVEKDETEK